MRPLAFVLSGLLFLAAAQADEEPKVATVAEPGRSLDRALDVALRRTGSMEAVRALDAHEDAGVRTLSAACLLVLGDPDGEERLVAALEAGGPGTRQAYRLRNLLNAVKPLSEAILAALLARLEAATDVNEVRALIDLLAEHARDRSLQRLQQPRGGATESVSLSPIRSRDDRLRLDRE